MTILEDAGKVQQDAKTFMDTLGEQFIAENKGKTVIVFPYKKVYIVHDNPLEAVKMAQEKFPRELSHTFTL